MSDVRLIMEPMEIGNLMYAEYEGLQYAGADKEWCRIMGDGSYLTVTDVDLSNRLHRHWIQTKFQTQFHPFITKHLKLRAK